MLSENKKARKWKARYFQRVFLPLPNHKQALYVKKGYAGERGVRPFDSGYAQVVFLCLRGPMSGSWPCVAARGKRNGGNVEPDESQPDAMGYYRPGDGYAF